MSNRNGKSITHLKALTCPYWRAARYCSERTNIMNTTNEPSAVCVFDDLDKAERSIDEFRRAGFQSEEIGIIGHVGQDSKVPTPGDVNEPEANVIDGFVRGAV